MDEPHRQTRSVGADNVHVEHLRLDTIRVCPLNDGKALDRHDVADIGGPRLELGEVDADPLGERGVQVADAPSGSSEKKPAGA